MATNRQPSTTQEDKDENKQEPHNPVEAGRKAIEASKLTNDNGIPASEQQEAAEKDAEQWRNEG